MPFLRDEDTRDLDGIVKFTLNSPPHSFKVGGVRGGGGDNKKETYEDHFHEQKKFS